MRTIDSTQNGRWEQICRQYATSADDSLPSPTLIKDNVMVILIVVYGSEVPEDLQMIMDTPGLLELLRWHWADEPPSKEAIDVLNRTAEGRELLRKAL